MFGRPWSHSSLPRPPASVPEGLRIYAIGDIHGRLDCLNALLEMIARDAAGYPGRRLVIGLGDYIDRGPDPRRVLERLMAPLGDGLEGRYILGNHDRVLLELFGDTSRAPGWLTYGGLQTLASYGIPFQPGHSLTADRLAALQEGLRAGFPADHREWLQALPTHLVYGDYYFVHAGVRPGVPLDQQVDSDRMWIRGGFLDHEGELEKVVVHGHTISEDVEIRPHRIGIDTGAYATGRLTALVLEGQTRRILQTGSDELQL